MESIGSGLNTIQQIRAGAAGTIKISTECYSFYQGLPLFIQKMKVLYPEIEVDLVLEATHKPVEKMISNEIDIAVVTSKPAGNEDLVSIEVFEDEIFAVIHQENLLNNSEYLTASDFQDVHLIIHSYPLRTVSVYERFLSPSGIMPVKISAVPLTEVTLEMVQANIGITCMPKWALKAFRISDELKFKKIGSDGLKRKHYLVVRKSDIGKKYINDFLLNFKEYFQNFG